ncbi:leucine--tRNA ligase [Rhodoflexus caldus]|uniref:leucine--tRNA ligase n=1 Tax=Rhodoflexus caldus TaxID=2891236 RepID=UPI00293E1AB6|nr:leucine--tRNA ligase [Rhodoflexus caldus]
MALEYNHREIEAKWQRYWRENNIYKTYNDTTKPKYYVLDMFPYPSGAGLHVGHPLGYIASDIVARFKRLKGFNVLHPMGFDSFGLPAEQYAIDTGQHPAVTTAKNIDTFKSQLNKIGFSYDWEREVQTSSPDYYRWTQWIFMQIFNSWYDLADPANEGRGKAKPIGELIAVFEKEGNLNVRAACDEDTPTFTAAEWNAMSEPQQQEMLLKYRLTYPADEWVNWCPALGSVLSNDEVKDGVSERGGFPVERKKMRQWMMRITAYAERLLQDLNDVDFSESLKEMQRNWIGKSVGAEVSFALEGHPNQFIKVYTTRLDTIYGVTFMVLAPEHELVEQLVTPDRREEVMAYVKKAKNRSERERMADTKTVSGVFTGSYCINPFSGEKVPVWLADYVLAGYGTGAVMAVPSGDQRDYTFAKHFGLPIVQILDAQKNLDKEADATKEGRYVNSGMINGLTYAEAMPKLLAFLEEKGIGKAKVNYRMRDAVFSRQRYWGEPVPVYFDENNIPRLIDESELPLVLPEIDEYKPTPTGEPPLGRATDWKYRKNGKEYRYELSTMPGWAGSSWYFLRYMDARNDKVFADCQAIDYWNQVDLYVGGTEHAVGHLLYSRFWHKFLFDRGYVGYHEPYKKLLNQGKIQGRSAIIYKLKNDNKFVSKGLKDQYGETIALHAPVNIVENDVLDVEAYKQFRPEYADAEFICENGKFICDEIVEKMSKSKYNVVNPDDVVERYGADTLRLYEMFLGPIEADKPWSTHGIEGVYKFLRKLWRLFFDEKGNSVVTDGEPTAEELKILHKTIRKVEEDIENFSFNTTVSQLMICVNELSSLKCHKAAVLNDLLIVLSPYAPHIAEELWAKMGHTHSIVTAQYPRWNAAYLVESVIEYPISINGKVRGQLQLGADLSPQQIEQEVLASEIVKKYTEGKTPKKVIVVPKKIVNVVL